MKILLVNDYEHHAGAEAFCHSLIKGLKERGHESALLTPAVYIDYDDKKVTSAYEQPINLKEFDKPDLVNFNNICLVGLEPLKYCIENNIPHIWTLHDYYLVCKKRTMQFDDATQCNAKSWKECSKCEHRLTNLPDPQDIYKVAYKTKIVTTCNYMKNIFGRFGYSNIEVIKNGIDLTKFKPTWKDDGHFLWSGRFHFEKGLPIYLEAAHLMHNDADFLITGGQTPDEKVTDFGHAHYKGYLPFGEYTKLLQSARAFCITSTWPEPVGYTQLEAQACGKPIIGFMTGGLPEYVPDGKAGMLVNLDPTEYWDAIDWFIENPEKAKEMGKNAYENVQQYDINKTIDNYIDLYNREIEQK